MISASGKVGVSVMVELCQRVLDGNDMPDEWQTSVLVPIFMKKGDVRIQQLVNIDPMQFGFMRGRGTTHALFVERRMQEEYRDKKKFHTSFVDIDKAFDRVARKVTEWAIRKVYQK